jgi:DNA gyrase subunit B
MEAERRRDAGGEAYGPESIKVLSDLDAVRYRPGMYIGDTHDGSGLHNMVYAVAGNAINEGLAGDADLVSVALNSGGSVTVEDNGEGILAEIHPREGVSVAESIMTRFHFRAAGKFDEALGHFRQVGVYVVNALSMRLELTIWRGGQEHFMAFADGVPEAPLKAVKNAAGKTGTRVTFTPNPAIFSTVEFDYATLERRLRELAFLNAGIDIVLSDLRGARPIRSEFKI